MGPKETGAVAALPIFKEIVSKAYHNKLVGPVPKFPEEIEEDIDAYLRGTSQ